jgi:MSHA biogenesis protein MshL
MLMKFLKQYVPLSIWRSTGTVLISLALLNACSLPRQIVSKRHVSEAPTVVAALTPPSIRPVRLPAMPPAPMPRASQEVFSVVVNDVSVKTLLFALARDNKLNVDIHPSVGGRVTLNATDQTLPQLLERIASQSDIRYEINGNLLRVQPDTPYMAQYAIDYVNLQRQSSSNVSVSSALGGTGSSSGAGSSDSSIKSSTDNRFWDTLVSNVCQIVVTSNQNRNQRDEQIERQRQSEREDRLKVALELTKALQPAPNAAGVGANQAGAAVGFAGSSAGAADLMRQVMGSIGTSGTSSQGDNGAGVNNGGTNNRSGAGASNTNISNNPATNISNSSPCGGSTNNNQGGGSSINANNPLMVNKESGVLGVNTTSKGHEQVRAFIDKVMSGARRQVLIEATVVEVQLSAASQSGINWSQLVTKGAASGLAIGIGPSGTGSISSAVTSANTGGTISYSGTNNVGTIAAAISLLESFGQTKVLSSPKLSVINNQTALIKVVDDYVYVTIEFMPGTRTTNGGIVTQTTPDAYTSKINTIPVGFVMTVTPQISDAGEVTLNVRPSITRVIRTIVDPNPALLNVPRPIVNLIPIVQSRELESILRVQSGEIAVLGGLMQESNSSAEEGLPGINRTAVLGTALGQRSEARSKTELVVFMRPVVIKDASINGDYKEYKSQLPTSTFFNGTAAEAWGTKK